MSHSNKLAKRRDHHHSDGSGSSGGGGPSLCCCCKKAPKSHCISATGVLLLVLFYTAMGSIIFVTLEGEFDDGHAALETAVAASKPYPRTELANAEIRSRTVDRLWAITEDLNILYKENWTRLAAQEVQLFQDTLLRAVHQVQNLQQYRTGAAPSALGATAGRANVGGLGVMSGHHITNHKWTYASAFLYSLTLITTIGYGGISPRTQWGRVAALIYAGFGIPIVLLYLSAMGEALSSGMRCIFRKIRSKSTVCNGRSNSSGSGSGSSVSSSAGNEKVRNNSLRQQGGSDGKNCKFANAAGKQYVHLPPPHSTSPSASQHYAALHANTKIPYYSPNNASPSIPIAVCVMVLICYVAGGALIFHKMQNWTVLEALYFCFTSLGTIGFGELAPTGTVTLYLASGYIMIGMAVVAMCFSLIQTEIVLWLRKFSVQDHVIPKNDDLALVSVAMANTKPS